MRQYLLLAVAVTFAAACSDDNTGANPGAPAQIREDIAVVSGEMISIDAEMMSRTDASGGASLFGFAGAIDPGNCSVLTDSILCTRTVGDLSGDAAIVFTNAAGDTTSYDGGTTAMAEIETGIEGDVLRNDANLEIDFQREGQYTITGLAGDETTRTWAGVAQSTIGHAKFNGGTRDYALTATTTFEDVVVPAGTTTPQWPSAGTATILVDYHEIEGPNDRRDGSVAVTVTFNGTANVPLTVDDETFMLNLDSHLVSSAS